MPQPLSPEASPERCGLKKNVIILTSGLSGSSVLTALIARGGYWIGDSTVKKEYDTHENLELVELNKCIIRSAGYVGRYEMEFRADLLARIGSMWSGLSDTPYTEFLTNCDRHEPWIWKDPRLWVTIRYWHHLVDWKRCTVIVLTRNLVHRWISTTLRRQVRSYPSLKRYELSIEASIYEFLNSNQIGYVHLTYEQLVTRPKEAIAALNAHLGASLGIDDLKAVYHGKLYKNPRTSPLNYLLAALIYIKNYSERWDLTEKRT